MNRTRWMTDTPAGHSDWLIGHFRSLAEDGADLGGEARFVSAVVPLRSSVLDAGCGTGRVGAVLHAAGHDVVGVDADDVLIREARRAHPDIDWLLGDLAMLDLRRDDGSRRVFDCALLAGNVMPFLEPGTEIAALRAVASHVRAGSPVIVGFGSDRGYSVDHFDGDVAKARLSVENRFSTWNLDPWQEDSPFCVTILRGRGRRIRGAAAPSR